MWRLPHHRALKRLYAGHGRDVLPPSGPVASPIPAESVYIDGKRPSDASLVARSRKVRQGHRRLFARVHDFYRAMTRDPGVATSAFVLDAVIAAAGRNFSDEEDLLRSFGSWDYGRHLAAHRDIMADLTELQRRLLSGSPPTRQDLTHAMDALLVHHLREESGLPLKFA